MIDTCVFDYHGKCAHSSDKGVTSKDKCKYCADYRSMRMRRNEELLRRLIEDKARITEDINAVLSDIAECAK